MNKYKKLSKNISFFAGFVPAKIFNFKRSKWLFLKSFLRRKKYLKKARFHNFAKKKIKKGAKYFKRTKSTFKFGLSLKKAFFFYFGSVINTIFLKKLLSIKKLSLPSIFLVKPLFRVDALLWRFKLFSSIRVIKQCIINKKIKVNNKIITHPIFLKKGDIISVDHLERFLKRRFFLRSFYLSFCEVDIYTNSIAILKDIVDCTESDTCHLFKEIIDYKSLRYYVYKM